MRAIQLNRSTRVLLLALVIVSPFAARGVLETSWDLLGPRRTANRVEQTQTMNLTGFFWLVSTARCEYTITSTSYETYTRSTVGMEVLIVHPMLPLTVGLFPSEDQALYFRWVKQAVAIWNQAITFYSLTSPGSSIGHIRLFAVANTSDARIGIRLSDAIHLGGDVGLTEYDAKDNGELRRVMITVAPLRSEVQFVNILVHELGHALGLGHTRGYDVMNPQLRFTYIQGPSQLDLYALDQIVRGHASSECPS